MEDLVPWLTPALIVGLFGWLLRADVVNLRQDTNRRFDDFKQDLNQRFDGLTRDMNKRFDEVNRELADQRERMAKLEGSLEGFLAGRRDRDAA